MNFRAGQKVRCIATWRSGYPRFGYKDETGPVAGGEYTIREIVIRAAGETFPGSRCCRLVEITNRIRPYAIGEGSQMWEPSFCLSRFRPLVEVALPQSLTALLDPAKHKQFEDAR